MTPAERLRWLAGDCQATSAWASDLKAGADALDRVAELERLIASVSFGAPKGVKVQA